MMITAIPTNHSIKRGRQRGVSQKMIEDTITFGNMIRKQGLRFFIMTEKCLSYFHEKQYNERVKNTVVVISADNTILTVYKSSRALKNIKKKSKQLWR